MNPSDLLRPQTDQLVCTEKDGRVVHPSSVSAIGAASLKESVSTYEHVDLPIRGRPPRPPAPLGLRSPALKPITEQEPSGSFTTATSRKDMLYSKVGVDSRMPQQQQSSMSTPTEPAVLRQAVLEKHSGNRPQVSEPTSAENAPLDQDHANIPQQSARPSAPRRVPLVFAPTPAAVYNALPYAELNSALTCLINHEKRLRKLISIIDSTRRELVSEYQSQPGSQKNQERFTVRLESLNTRGRMVLEQLQQVDREMVVVCRKLFALVEFWLDWMNETDEGSWTRARTDLLLAMWERIGWEFEIEAFFESGAGGLFDPSS